MAGPFHVFVDGATTPGPAAARKLAEAMAARYGLGVDDLAGRLATGRFRVKANVDRATADEFVRDLAAIGARCSIEDASATAMATAATAATAAMAAPPARASAPLMSTAALPARPITEPAARTSTTPHRPSAALTAGSESRPSSSNLYQSGLSAAFSGQIDSADLGALAGDDKPLSLASLDGTPEARTAGPVFAAPPPPLPPAARIKAPTGSPAARSGSASAPPSPSRAESATNAPAIKPAAGSASALPSGPIDMFAPPDAEEAQMNVELAPDELAHQARKRATNPPATEPANALIADPAKRFPRTSTSPVRTVPEAPRPRGKLGPLGDPKIRYVLGVAVAILLGFVPAHMVASMREHSAFASIDSKVTASQAAAESEEDYAALDAMRTDALDHKRSEQRSIAMMALAIWAVAGGAIAYGWFRAVPWDRLDNS